ncbi:MAG: M1 family metallopeptidase [Acidobacteriota bacterium]|nr:M1 family metallopeptidase [Acidobacteriota bacterium]
MRFSLLPVLLITTFVPGAEPPVLFPEPLSPRIANYRIQVKLLPATRQLLGEQMILWRNTTPDPVYDLHFHLYLNGFRNSRTTFMNEAEGVFPGEKLEAPDSWGYLEIVSLRLKLQDSEPTPEPVDELIEEPETSGVDEGPVLPDVPPLLDFSDPAGHPDPADMEVRTAAIRYLRPDDGNPYDKTYMMIPLDRPVEPGGAIWVQMTFRARLPQPPLLRTGAVGDFFFAGQWFPKIAVWEDASWTNHQFHYNTEFYADFGVYDVAVTVPEDHIVGATGVRVDVVDNGDGTGTHTWHAEDVHDFAWVSSPDFVEETRQVQDVAVRVLLHRAHRRQMKRHLDAAEAALSWFQNYYGDYPYPNLTLVDPAPGAGAVHGMEYPTLVTTGTRSHLPRNFRSLEATIVHEIGHNYWYHMAASNEFEEAWLDEGITSYTDVVFTEDFYGPRRMIDFPFLRAGITDVRRYSYLKNAGMDSTQRPGWTFSSNRAYGVYSYSKPMLLLLTLHHHLGPETMRKIMQTYLARFRFKHPKTDDFIAVVNEVSGRDLNGFFQRGLFTNAVLDYSVERAESQATAKALGFDFTADAGSGTERPLDPEGFANTVVVHRLGEFPFPVEVEFSFEDGSTRGETWDGLGIHKTFRFQSKSRMTWARVDPDWKIPLDIDFLNNSKRVTPSGKQASRAAINGLGLLQLLFDVISF